MSDLDLSARRANIGSLRAKATTDDERWICDEFVRLFDAIDARDATSAALRRLANRLDRLADNCSEAAVKSRTQDNAEYLLARASTYQECAGLIREALR